MTDGTGITGADAPPFFVVGAPRSGTTLTRLMLDSHPRIAVPNESHFVVRLAYRRLRLMHRPDLALERILAHPHFPRWGMDPDEVRAFVKEAGPRTYPEVVRCVFAAFAAKQGKQRWGDKTPGYVHKIRLLARLFPDARFIHVIRDGREVAASVSERRFSPGSAVSAAFWWRRYVRLGRRGGRLVGSARYLELRLADLIADPETELRRVCAFLDEEYDPAMLSYPGTARTRLAVSSDGPLGPVLAHVEKPPTAGLRDWRPGLSDTMADQVEAAAYPMLRRLGFPVERPRLGSRLRARWRWARHLPPRVVLFARDQLHPERASF